MLCIYSHLCQTASLFVAVVLLSCALGNHIWWMFCEKKWVRKTVLAGGSMIVSAWQKMGVKHLINAQAWRRTPSPGQPHCHADAIWMKASPYPCFKLLPISSHWFTVSASTCHQFLQTSREREGERDGHSLRCLISVQGAFTKREMNMFAFDTADPETAAVFLCVCVCVCCLPVCCAIHHIGTQRQANDVTQSGETTCSGKRCLNCQWEPLITFARGCDSLQRGAKRRDMLMFLLFCDYIQRLASVLMVYTALGDLCRVDGVCCSNKSDSAMLVATWLWLKRWSGFLPDKIVPQNCIWSGSRRWRFQDLDYWQPNSCPQCRDMICIKWPKSTTVY